jgi:hypothetical protein
LPELRERSKIGAHIKNNLDWRSGQKAFLPELSFSFPDMRCEGIRGKLEDEK